MFRAIARHVAWLTIVLGTGFFIYENWRVTGSRLELVTLILIGILVLRMCGAAYRNTGFGVGIISIAIACLASPLVGFIWATLLGHFHQPLSQRRQWGFLFIFAVANLGLRSKAQRPPNQSRRWRESPLEQRQPSQAALLGPSHVDRDSRNLFEITLPAMWKEKPAANAVINATFAREIGRAEITISIGPVDMNSGQYAQATRLREIRRLIWMEKDREISSEPFGRYENVIKGAWTLDPGRDWGPKGTARWPIASRRGLMSIVTGPPHNSTEWVVQYRTEPEYVTEIEEIVSSLCLLNEQL